MRPAGPQQQLNDDGTPRRKYEPDDAVSSKYVLRASIGFVLANAFLIAKNLMFGAEAAQKQSPPLFNTAMKEDGEHAVGPDVASLEDDETYGDGMMGDQPDGGTVRLLQSSLSAPRAFSDPVAARSAPGPTFDQTHGNDNVALYGAAPGRPIVIFSGDDGRDSLPLSGSGGGGSSGGSGSGGSGSSGSGSGHHDEPGPGDQSGDGHGDDDGEQDPLPRFNRLPVIAGPVILPALLMNQSVVIALSDLLRNASDPDGDQLTVRDFSPSSGTLQARGDGSWNFTPTSGDTSDVTFTYTVSDGNGGSAQATAALDLVPADRNVDNGRPDTIIGTDGPDTIVGTPYNDVIDALSGDDIVLGREGDDVIFGGDGNDRIVAGDGNDVVYAGAGDDVVFGGAGRDTIFGGAGNDLLFGDDGNDVLIGEAGNDTIWGGTGDDIISGGAGDDNLYGEDGDDFLDGGAGHNYLDGGAGADTILVRTGDTALGATGNDTFILAAHSSTPPTPVADPGPAHSSSSEAGEDDVHDAVSPETPESDDTSSAAEETDAPATQVTEASHPVTDSGSAHSSSSEAGEDDVHDTVLPEASEPNDTSIAAAQTDAPAQVTETSHQNPTALSKAAVTQILSIADDPIDVPENHDEITHIDGGGDRDTIDASGLSAPLTLNLKIGAATSTDIGYVTIVDVEDVKGGSGANTIVGSDAGNNLTGGASCDIILGEDGRDHIDGGKADDILAGGRDADEVKGGDGRDIIIATSGDGDDHYDGGAGSDTYNTVMTSADMTVDLELGSARSTETGNDTLIGIENVECGDGDDTIVANEAVNTLAGGDGADTFVFGSVAAIGQGSGSRDRILDFAVGDRIDLDHLSDEFVDDLNQAFGDQVIRRFVLIGSQETFTEAGQMKFHYEDLGDRQVTILEGNINSDANAEFELELVGQVALRNDDFTHSH